MRTKSSGFTLGNREPIMLSLGPSRRGLPSNKEAAVLTVQVVVVVVAVAVTVVVGKGLSQLRSPPLSKSRFIKPSKPVPGAAAVVALVVGVAGVARLTKLGIFINYGSGNLAAWDFFRGRQVKQNLSIIMSGDLSIGCRACSGSRSGGGVTGRSLCLYPGTFHDQLVSLQHVYPPMPSSLSSISETSRYRLARKEAHEEWSSIMRSRSGWDAGLSW
ncbi:hypothetical protein E2C01_009739 [Portunus trituberculatus]|uniref:Uncharacterized protein n=1 Tax=Portunus trituberculatus TaxID=210409 RepID=A0A5B7D6J3_PORTR|nr:hypothetical protein [Portunus trituberculatus]